ncbi:unnamed protein product [Allacma fusca]|uniref:G-protein coupled receptors family 1 profile domain-containing protein n=1 Tax=Allacma fusca TaxID=39272 RepID=A0A8J2KNC0_9HEXA|nr:unnamed protein product [Allacma fusca]
MSLIVGNSSFDNRLPEGRPLNSSSNTTDNSTVTGRNESLANVEIAVLSIILILAVVGNGVMLLALRRQLQYRPMSRMYFFMLNLSVADLLVAFGNILPQLAWDITFRFKGPDILCRAVKFLQVFVLYLSTYVLTSMAVDRYLVVCHHSFSRNHYGGLKGPKILIITSWIISFIFASPQAFIFSLHELQDGVIDCWVTFIEPWGARAYVTWFVVSVFVLPLLVIGASYGAICIKVVSFSLPSESRDSKSKAQNKKKYSLSSSSDHRRGEHEPEHVEDAPLQKMSAERGALRRQISQAKIKTLKLTLVVVICFFVCWAPFCITQLIMVYGPSTSASGTQPVTVIFLLLASLNACTNPWIYLAFSESLFNQLRVCLGFGIGRGSDEESIGDEHEAPDPKKKQKIEHIDIARAQQPMRKGRSSIDHDSGPDDRIQPETKSDIL